MDWASSYSTLEDPTAAAEQAATALGPRLGDAPPALVLAFFTAPLAAGAESMMAVLRERLRPGCLVGASGSAVIAAEREIEGGPALVLAAAQLPEVAVRPFILAAASWGQAMEDPLEFARHTPGVAGAELVILLGDPFSLDVERVLEAFNTHAPGVRVVGGMASAGTRPHSNVLVLNDWIAPEGGVAVALSGALRADVVVSQGCRPLGPALEVTRAEHAC